MARSGDLDLDYLDRQVSGDRALARELLGLFDAQCVRLLPIILGGGEAAARADAAHTLTGAARAVGATRVALRAAAVEREFRSGQRPDVADLGGRLVVEVEAVRAALAADPWATPRSARPLAKGRRLA